ncbi:cryptochrome/photolyase family protein [Salsipaludibacter albus]|uniref:cryptochrome/photolyase family protein n=1 Tax=Salsipaludibacter albus TaxID=2849650 RepID=UPI001EE45C20|nr:cryptochrome/photolyase family protein [Salsipaludibacter albus]MBY5163869.1 cryptochrome/photolyase family protein [Salsipaludibacter albus]
METVWVLGDQLNRGISSLAGREPGDTRVLLVESTAKLTSQRWHRQRAHLVLAGMRRFAAELADAGFVVDHRRADSLRAGLHAHVDEHDPDEVVAMEPASFDGLAMLHDEGVTTTRNNHFTCHWEDFAAWADQRESDGGSFRMEDFYRWQRRRLDVLMDGDEPTGGRWNLDHDNREPPPTDARDWPSPVTSDLDDLDHAVLADLDALSPDATVGADPTGLWPTSRRRALARLRHAVDEVLPRFGTHQDAMLTGEPFLAHTLLSPALNLGMLTPLEVVEAVEDAHRSGHVPLNAAEGFIRQVIGWREYAWGLYWRWMPEHRDANHLDATRPLPPVLAGDADTDMACVAAARRSVHDHGYAHHIQRLMVLGNLALLAGVEPWAMTRWMWSSFVDGAEWVMLPNVVGMALYADGGRMATKPYAAGGNYIDRMSDHCGDCRYDRRARVGDDACPFTTLYWDFLDRHRDTFTGNHRLARPLSNLDRLSDLPAVRERATVVLDRLDEGTL